MPDPSLVCSQVRVSYPEFTLELDISLREGEMVSIIGPSGCGKSTSLQLITGLLACDEGSILLNGTDITSMPVWQRNIGMVFQDYALFPHLTVAKNIAYSLRLKKMEKKVLLERVRQLLDLVGLQGFEHRRINGLSGGERQRVALARALASEPTLLLLDEPLSALDAKLRRKLRQQIRQIHDATGITTVYVTHDQEEALTMSDRVIVMQQGRVEQFDTPEEIYNHPSTLYAARSMGEGTVLPYTLAEQTQVSTDRGPASEIVPSGTENREIFFRPERVIVHDNPALAFPEFLPHLRFTDAELKSCEYQGGRYLLTCAYAGYDILAYSRFRPKHSIISLGVRLQDLVEYSDGTVARS